MHEPHVTWQLSTHDLVMSTVHFPISIISGFIIGDYSLTKCKTLLNHSSSLQKRFQANSGPSEKQYFQRMKDKKQDRGGLKGVTLQLYQTKRYHNYSLIEISISLLYYAK